MTESIREKLNIKIPGFELPPSALMGGNNLAYLTNAHCVFLVMAPATKAPLLKQRIKGSRQTRVKEHMDRAKRIAIAIWARFQVGPYQYKLKHLRWYVDTCTKDLASNTRYRHWLTIRHIITSLDKNAVWGSLFEDNRWGF
ncbi:hypothetical protein N9J88_07270 [Porticoccaceae bacterium]|nr:hypothetical protein [Porticoccaceae bacterium]